MKDKKKKSSITVSRELLRILNDIKNKEDFSTIEEVIRIALNSYKR